LLTQLTAIDGTKDDAEEKQNASERINLQHIMELREAFEAADTDKGGALEIDEVSCSCSAYLKINDGAFHIVQRCLWWCYWKRHERKGAEAFVHED